VTQPLDSSDDVEFRSAEQWLADRGIDRQRIRVAPSPQGPGGSAGTPEAPGTSAGPPPSAREARQLATEPPPAVPGEGHDVGTPASGDQHPDLSDEVSRAVAFIRRSTSATPASSGRLRRKLADRDVPAPAIRLALEQARDQGLVDDDAFAAALADEGRAKGHAPKRIRQDLRKREFDDDVIEAALARHADRDPEAVAFDVARRKARSLGGVDAEKAFRRLVGHLTRRGHNQWVARKVARQVVFNELEDDVISGH
jgi:regulatory protein